MGLWTGVPSPAMTPRKIGIVSAVAAIVLLAPGAVYMLIRANTPSGDPHVYALALAKSGRGVGSSVAREAEGCDSSVSTLVCRVNVVSVSLFATMLVADMEKWADRSNPEYLPPLRGSDAAHLLDRTRADAKAMSDASQAYSGAQCAAVVTDPDECGPLRTTRNQAWVKLDADLKAWEKYR